MLEIRTGPDQKLCDGTTRRDFLRAGFLGIAGLTLADVLRMESAQAAELCRPAGSSKNVILIWLHGGQTQLDTYDMKPGAPA